MAKKSVSILYLSVGSGHQVAAESLAGAIQCHAPDLIVHAEDPFSHTMKFLPSAMTSLQAATNLLLPNLYDAVWRRGNVTHTPIESSNWWQELLFNALTRHNPGVIVATHVMPCLIVNQLKQTGRLPGVKLFGAITDYGLNPIWPAKNMDGYFVAHEELRQALVYRGVDPKIVHVTGIPIRPSFHSSAPNPSSRLRVLIIAGGIRSGGYATVKNQIGQILQALDGIAPHQLGMTIVAGNQPRIAEELKQLASKSRHRLTVLGFAKNMENLMATHDILISKPGGLTVAEALASGLPFILSQPTPGVEIANKEFLVRHGVVLSGETVEDTIKSLRLCIENPNLLQQMKSQAKKLGYPHASANAAQIVLAHLTGAPNLEQYQPSPQPQAELISGFHE